MSKKLIDEFVHLKEKEVIKIVKNKLNSNQAPSEIINDMRKAMEIIGNKFASNEYFIPELMYSGEIMKTVTKMLKPKLLSGSEGKENQCLGKVIIGTVEGDIHNIGKDLVVFILEANGFDVVDLGVDVGSKQFVEKIKETKSPIVGLSGLLTVAFDSMKNTIDMISSEGLREDVKIIIGGSQVNEVIKNYTGADAFGQDAMSAVLFAKKWIGV